MKQLGETAARRWSVRLLLGTGLLAVSGAAPAVDWRLGEAEFRLQGRVALGATWRTSDRDERLLAKLNVPGQETLCDADDCISLAGDPEPNQRLVDARGGYNVNGDNGNLNYAQGDIAYATAQYEPVLTLDWGRLAARVSGLAFFDPVNSNFDTFNQNTLYQPRHVPRRHDLEADLGSRFRLLEAFVSFPVQLFGKPLGLAIGQQTLRWGESTFLVFSSLNQVNPVSAQLLRQPGTRLRNAFVPVPLFTADWELSRTLVLGGFYQLDWEPSEPDVAGSLLSISDGAGAGRGPTNITLGIGQYPEDPNRQFRPAGLAGTFSSATRTTYLRDERFGYPRDSGQFGLRAEYYADWLNGGTELTAYGMNYHSRLPYLSGFAAEESCLRDLDAVDPQGLAGLLPQLVGPLPGGLDGVIDETRFAQALVACGGFNGSLNVVNGTLLEELAAAVPGTPEIGGEPTPVDTFQPFVDYPEDIRLFGVSGTTNIGSWSVAGEIAYSPNQPVQVHTRDVVFAGLNPAFPAEDIGVATDTGAVLTIPGARAAVPDYLQTRYRDQPLEGGQRFNGYERLQVGQASFTAIRVFSSSNYIHADQILLLVEAGATGIFNLPPLSELQIEGAGATNTHFSPGADGSGSGGEPDTRRANPEQANPNIFADDFAWGYRVLLEPSYLNALFGWSIFPRLRFDHDVHGTSASPIQNFVADRIEITAGFATRFTPNTTLTMEQTVYAGAGDRNLRQDRDHFTAVLTYAF
jgi:hypothetical protein